MGTTSLSSRALTGAMHLKQRLTATPSVTTVQHGVAAAAIRPRNYTPPRFLDRFGTFSITEQHGWPTYAFRPKHAQGHHLIYLHGGSYTGEILPIQWIALARVAKLAGATLHVPIYPVAPASTAEETVAKATNLVADLITREGQENVTLTGDSAGGGLALAVAQTLRDRGLQPKKTILISPWLDATMSDPEVWANQSNDRMISAIAAGECGRIYAGDLSTTDPRVSPIYGSLHGLAPISVYTGTHDILNADSHALRRRAADAGIPLTFHEAPGQQHVYPILPIREGWIALRQIAAEVG